MMSWLTLAALCVTDAYFFFSFQLLATANQGLIRIFGWEKILYVNEKLDPV